MSARQFDIPKIAKLARIDIPADKESDLQKQMDQVLEFVSILEKLDLSDVEPFFGVEGHSVAPTRQDLVQPGLKRESALQNAPATDGRFFLVPPVFE